MSSSSSSSILALYLQVEVSAEAYEANETEANRTAYEKAKADYLKAVGVEAE